MALTQEQILQRTGRPLPPPLPTVAELLDGIVKGVAELGGKVSPARYASVQSHLSGVLSNVKADLADVAKDAQVKQNQENAEKLKAAQAAASGGATGPGK
jgi:hypothetical protein